MAHETKTSSGSSKTIFFVGFAGLLLYTVITLITIYIGEKDFVSSDAERAKNRLEKRLKIDEEGAKRLSTYGWIDKSKGTIHIPIEQAMELEVQNLKQREVLNK